MKRQYSGFTLVEMLIVMGILAILMTIGIAVGRFAIQRANEVQHTSAANQLSQAVQAYFTENRKYPATISASPTTGVLKDYIDGSFDGGSPATFYYDVSDSNQAYIICVSLGGLSDADELGYYCTGDGFGESSVFGGAVTKKENDAGGAVKTALDATPAANKADWDGETWSSSTATE